MTFKVDGATDGTGSKILSGTGMGGQIEIGAFDVRSHNGSQTRWGAGGAWIGAGAGLWSINTEKYKDFTMITPYAQATFEWLPGGIGAFFVPEGRIRGVTRVKVMEGFHCDEYYDAGSKELKECSEKQARYLKKAQRQRAVEVAENRCD